MEITEKEIDHLAELSRLYVEKSDVGRVSSRLGEIISYMDSINGSVKTDDIDEGFTEAELMPREDVVCGSFDVAALLESCPEHTEDTPTVPRVVD